MISTVKQTQELTISEIEKKYPRQWVTINITRRDIYGMPDSGEVIFASPNKAEIVTQITNLTDKSNLDLYLHYTGTINDQVA